MPIRHGPTTANVQTLNAITPRSTTSAPTVTSADDTISTGGRGAGRRLRVRDRGIPVAAVVLPGGDSQEDAHAEEPRLEDEEVPSIEAGHLPVGEAEHDEQGSGGVGDPVQHREPCADPGHPEENRPWQLAAPRLHERQAHQRGARDDHARAPVALPPGRLGHRSRKFAKGPEAAGQSPVEVDRDIRHSPDAPGVSGPRGRRRGPDAGARDWLFHLGDRHLRNPSRGRRPRWPRAGTTGGRSSRPGRPTAGGSSPCGRRSRLRP